MKLLNTNPLQLFVLSPSFSWQENKIRSQKCTGEYKDIFVIFQDARNDQQLITEALEL